VRPRESNCRRSGKARWKISPRRGSRGCFYKRNESFLGQIVRQRDVAPRELSQQTANARLMTTNQLAKSVLVVINKNSGDKAGIG